MRLWKEFCGNPFGVTMLLAVCILVGSCTARTVYCEWADCTKTCVEK